MKTAQPALREFTVIGLWEEASSSFIVAGVLEGDHDLVDDDEYLPVPGLQRAAYLFNAHSAAHAMDLASAGFTP